jgi:glyoxylase-like metal-dependent hydrolase (beta-lactamase superfamily II)
MTAAPAGEITGSCIDALRGSPDDHRTFQRGCPMIARIVSAACFLCVSTALADTPSPPEAQSIARGVWLIPGGMLANRQPDGNTIVFDAPQGLVVMDTGRHRWHREAILDFAKAEKKPIAAIVNSHWHLDHVSGNPDIRAAYPGLKVYASNAIDGALTGFLKKSAADAQTYLDGGKLPPETAEDVRNDIATYKNGQALRPNVVIDKSGTRDIAGKRLAVNLAANAATDGDVWVYDPATKIAAAGDLITLPAPFLDTACPAGWSKALGAIQKTGFTTIIPGHGAPMNRVQFGIYRKAFDDFIACAASTRDEKDCAAGWTKAVSALPGAGPDARAQGMAVYYVKDVLRAHNGKSAECKI